MTNPTPKRGLGCAGVILILLSILLVVVVGGAGIGFYRMASKLLPYTAEKPVMIAIPAANPEAYAQAQAELNKARNPQPAATATFTDAQLNALVASAPEWKPAQGRVNVRIENGTIGILGAFSMPNLPLVAGRYFNGSVWFVPAVRNNAFLADIQRLESDGKPLPAQLQKDLDMGFEEALRTFLARDPVIGPVLNAAKKFEVNGNAVTVTF